ncbi:translation initiation factor IF-2 N-terminal domain-containing protein [Acidimicrobiaceae bacterium]|nr:translation initiation factor IF-2 N-terminal domain-containing protein [Acidimicrobiaceae bacterium]
MKVFELAKKLNKKSREILDAAKYLNIQIKSHLSNLNDDEVKLIIKYFRKRRFIFFFKKYLTPLLLIFLLTILFFIIYPQSVVSGEIDASVNEVGELSLDWEINESIDEGAILVESESQLLIIEIDESIGNVVECCFEEDLNILLLLTDDNDEIIEVESVNLPLSNKSISTTSTSTTTSTTIPECNDEDFQPYTLYDSEGNANTVLTCRNEQDALEAGFIYTVNPNPAEPNTTLAPTTTSTTSTTLAPTTTSTTSTTLGLLKDEIPSDDSVRESSSCRTVTKGTHIGKNKFQYQAVFTSDTKEYEYKLRFRFNGKKWKDWNKANFKSIGGKRDRLRIKIQKIATKKKHEISSFEYEFTYRNKVDKNEKIMQVYAWDKDIPCAFIDPDNTTKSVNEIQRRLNFTDDFNTITPSNTIPSITSSTTTSSTTTSSTTTSSTTTSSTTTSSTTTSSTTTTIPEPTYIVYDRDCNEFGPYPINEYNEIIGDGSVYLGYCIIDVYATSTTTTTTTTIPEPPPQATPTTTTTTTTSTTTTTIPEPSYTATQSLGSCSGPSGTRTSTLTVTNNRSEARWYQYGQSLDDGGYFAPIGITRLDPGSTLTSTQVVPDGSSIIWRVNESLNSVFIVGYSDYVNLSASDTVDCPDGYYVNVDGSNTYALTVECRKWNDTTKVRFRANPWWGDYDLAKDYMFALIALTGDYDNGDSSVDVEDYFDYSQFTCGVVPGAYFAYQKGFVQFIGQAITAPSWNSTTDVEDGSSNNRDFYIFSELVP